MLKKRNLILCLFFLGACASSENEQAQDSEAINKWTVQLDELLGDDYPNNPDMSICHSSYTNIAYQNLDLKSCDDGHYDIIINPSDDKDTVILHDVDILEFMPTISSKVEGDEYLEKLGIVNQEWNRQQVKFLEGDFEVSGSNSQHIERVDIARNCLNSYLWEVIFYVEEDGVSKPYYHGWFDFPHELYAELFKIRNGHEFAEYSSYLEHWEDPEHESIQLSKLREVESEFVASFENKNNEEYPLEGERKKKQMNIMYPKNTAVIQDFLTDSTVFATFSPPGFYNQEDPRATELSRLANLDTTYFRTLTNGLFEVELVFNSDSLEKKTHFIVSGLDKNEIPTLAADQVNSGWQNSMGFGNHTFYETYESALAHPSKSSEYFGLLLDADRLWIDSHHVGIDGPMMHWDEDNPELLHFWILSFERHAFVGHYIINTSNSTI